MTDIVYTPAIYCGIDLKIIQVEFGYRNPHYQLWKHPQLNFYLLSLIP